MIKVIYWSGTGNTEEMANLIVKGIKSQGEKVEVKEVANASVSDAKDCKVLVLGCPSMGVEELEESEMEPFVKSLEGEVQGVKVALFGSYGWGDGEWMEMWGKRMEEYGAQLVRDSLIINEAPEGEDEEACVEFGREISKFAK